MKKALVIGLGVLVTFVALALVIPSFLDWNDYRDEIQDTVESLTGRELQIGGNISFRIVPSPALTVEQLTVRGETPNDPAFLELDHLDVRLAFFPLLKGAIEVESLVLVGAKIDLQKFEDGRSNWDFLNGNSESEVDGTETNDLKINRFEIQESQVRYRDTGLGRDDTIEALNAVIRAETAAGPFDIDAQFSYGSTPFELSVASGRIEERRSFPLSVTAIINQQTPGIQFQGTIVLDGAASAGSGQLKAGGKNLLKFVNGLSSLAMGEEQDYALIPVNLSQPFEFEAPLVLTKARLGSDNLTAKVGNSAGTGRLLYLDQGEARLELGLAINTVKYEEFYQSVEVADDSPLNFAVPILFDIQVGAVSYNDGIAQRLSIKGDAQGSNVRIERLSAGLPGSSNIELKGNYKVDDSPERFSGAFQLTSNRLRDLLNWIGYSTDEVPADKLAAFSIETDIGLTQEKLRLSDMVGQIDITAFSGDVDVQLAAPNAFSIKGRAERFNLDAYAPPNQDQRGAGGWANVVPQFDEALNDLAAFRGDLDLEVRQFGIADAQLGDLYFQASILENRVDIKRLDVTNFRGVSAAVKGQLLGLASRPSFNMNVDLKTDNIASLVRWMEVETPFDPFQLSGVSAKGNIAGRPDNLQIDLNGEVAGARYGVKGALNKLDPVPSDIDLEFNLSHPNAPELLRRFALPDFIKVANSRIAISGSATGPRNTIAIESNAELDAAKAQFKGAYQSTDSTYRVEGVFNASHPNVLAMSRLFGMGLSPANDNIGAFQLQTNIDIQPNRYGFAEVAGNAGSATLRGDLQINMQAERPTFAGNMRLGTLVLEQFMSPARSGAEQAKYAAGQRWSRTPFDFSEISKWDGTLTLAADVISYEKYRYNNPTMNVSLNNGVLKIDNFRGGLFGGRTSSVVQLDFKGTPIGSINFTLDEASLEDALHAAAAIKPATGRLSIATDLSFIGNNQFDIISSLAGSVELWTYNGVIKGIDIDRLSNRLGSISRLPDFLSLVGSVFAGGETPFQNIRTRFDGQKGVFTANSIDAQVEGANLSGALILNLPTWQLQGNSAIKLVSPPDAPAVGMAYNGDIDAPQIDYQTTELRNYMVRKFMAALAAQPIVTPDGATGSAGSPTGGVLDGILPSSQSPQAEQPVAQPPASAGAAILNGILGVLNRPAEQNSASPTEEDDGGGNR